jgi:hypothetical protein
MPPLEAAEAGRKAAQAGRPAAPAPGKPPAGHEETLRRTIERLQHRTALLEDRVSLLQEENEDFAERLRRHGEDVRHKSNIHVELPPPLSAPAPLNEDEAGLMNERERRLYRDLLGGETAYRLMLSESAADVGQWFWRSRVWLCVTAGSLLLFAAGRRPLLQRVPFAHIRESLYNHVTGELVLAPNRKYRITQVRLPPVEAYQVLAQIYSDTPSH